VVSAGDTLTVNAARLGAGEDLSFTASAKLAGSLVIKAGAGDDTLAGGAGDDVIFAGSGTNHITGGGGADNLFAGSGADTFIYGKASDSTGVARDIVHGFDAGADVFDLPGTVNAIDTEVSAGQLRGGAHFDADLAAAIGKLALGAHDAVLFDPTSGSLAGHTFLIVDLNGHAGYQSGHDLVIELTNPSLSNLTTANFV
jgi:Ca2+-binding RTX toxin-like protein